MPYLTFVTMKCNNISTAIYLHWVQSVRSRSFSGPYFLAFKLNTERYRVSLRCISPYSIQMQENTDQKKKSQHGYSSHSANSTNLFSYAVIRCNKWIYFASAMGLNHDAIALEFYANYVHHMKLFLTDYYVPPQNRGYECIFIYLCWKIYFFNFSELMLLKYVN